MRQNPRPVKTRPSPLQSTLLPRIVALIRADALPPGTRLAESLLAARLEVSRTPVRSALAHLAGRGLVRRAARGFVVGDLAALAAPSLAAAHDANDMTRLSLMIATDRVAGRLPERLSETDLMRRYEVGRATVQRALTQLAGLAAVERKPGHGWAFLPSVADPAARAESYRFRMVIEPAALLAPGFRLDPAWVRETRERHERMLAEPWRETASIAFYEMNAAFHEGLAAGSGNRFLLLAVQQQNRLRRLPNYDWGYGRDAGRVRRRVEESCREHLAILERAAHGDCARAALLMSEHLEHAFLLRPTPEGPAPAAARLTGAKTRP